MTEHSQQQHDHDHDHDHHDDRGLRRLIGTVVGHSHGPG